MAAPGGNGPRRPSEALVGGTPFDLAAAQTKSGKSRTPEILIGTFLVTLFALAGLWFYSTSNRTVAYVATARDIPQGAVIEEADLVAMELPEGASLIGIGYSQRSSVIGQTARTDMPAGILVHSDLYGGFGGVGANEAIVGVALDENFYPPSLANDDTVSIVKIPIVEAADINRLAIANYEILVPQARVLFIERDNDGDVVVSLVVSQQVAPLVVSAEVQNGVGLIVLPPGSTFESQTPADNVPVPDAEQPETQPESESG